MTITLTAEHERIIQAQLAVGQFRSVEDLRDQVLVPLQSSAAGSALRLADPDLFDLMLKFAGACKASIRSIHSSGHGNIIKGKNLRPSLVNFSHRKINALKH